MRGKQAQIGLTQPFSGGGRTSRWGAISCHCVPDARNVLHPAPGLAWEPGHLRGGWHFFAACQLVGPQPELFLLRALLPHALASILLSCPVS
eukprot:5934730-Amphidinium_carterae.1